MGFIADIQEKYKTVSIVGMAKNAGKTTALNYLLEEAYDEGLRMGVTSTGRDGETSDLVFVPHSAGPGAPVPGRAQRLRADRRPGQHHGAQEAL